MSSDSETETKVETKKSKAVKPAVLPKLRTKASFAKKRPLFVDSKGRQYHKKSTTVLSKYFAERVAKYTEDDGAEVAIYDVVLSGEQAVPSAGSLTAKFAKPIVASTEKDADGETKEPVVEFNDVDIHLYETSHGKYARTAKTGWIIASKPKAFLALSTKKK